MANENEKKDLDPSDGVTATANTTSQAGSNPDKKGEPPVPNPIGQNKDRGTIGASLIDPKIQAYIFAGLAVLGTAFLLFGVIGKNQILDRLSHIEHARGLITFTLTVGTISIAILVTLGALMGRDGEARERFYRAKEILTILIGVLGTIVGFYFGSQDSTAGRADLKLAAPILSDYTVGPEQPFTLTSFVSGGSPPYKYELSFEDNRIKSMDGYADDTGWVTKAITAPKADTKEAIQYTLKITDADKAAVTYISSKDKSIIVEPQ